MTGNFSNVANFANAVDVGPQFHHADVFHYLKKARLVVQQQHKGVGWIN